MSGNVDSVPPGMNPIALIDQCLQTLMIGHTFLVLLIPLLVALFYYSTPYSRRQPIFILNILALVLAFIVGVITDVLTIHTMYFSEHMWSPQLQITIGFIGIFQGMLVDTILLVRLATVHSLSRVGLVRFVLLISLPVTLKAARVVNVILYIDQLSIMANGPNALQRVSTAWIALPYMKIEWIAQVVDNSYASIAFLWTIWCFRTHCVSSSLMSAATFRQSSFTRRLQVLFNFALSNFIIPTVMSIIQLALVFRIGTSNPVLLNDITFVNGMVSVFGVVFATVWAGKEHREANMFTDPDDIPAERGRQCTCGLERWRVASHPSTNDHTSDKSV